MSRTALRARVAFEVERPTGVIQVNVGRYAVLKKVAGSGDQKVYHVQIVAGDPLLEMNTEEFEAKFIRL